MGVSAFLCIAIGCVYNVIHLYTERAYIYPGVSGGGGFPVA